MLLFRSLQLSSNSESWQIARDTTLSESIWLLSPDILDSGGYVYHSFLKQTGIYTTPCHAMAAGDTDMIKSDDWKWMPKFPLNIKLPKGGNWTPSRRFNSNSLSTILVLISTSFTPDPTLVVMLHLFTHQPFIEFPKCLEYPVLALHIYLYFECLIFDF